ncbi:MAG: hypothetical protein SNJ52_02840, partial [Verrucomicrobiia bacterium]
VPLAQSLAGNHTRQVQTAPRRGKTMPDAFAEKIRGVDPLVRNKLEVCSTMATAFATRDGFPSVDVMR